MQKNSETTPPQVKFDAHRSKSTLLSQLKKRWQLLVGVALFLLLVVGSVAGYYVSQRNTEGRSQASSTETLPSGCAPGYRSQCGSLGCGSYQQRICGSNETFGACTNTCECGHPSCNQEEEPARVDMCNLGEKRECGSACGSSNYRQTCVEGNGGTVWECRYDIACEPNSQPTETTCYRVTDGQCQSFTRTGACGSGEYPSQAQCRASLTVECWKASGTQCTREVRTGSCPTGYYSGKAACENAVAPCPEGSTVDGSFCTCENTNGSGYARFARRVGAELPESCSASSSETATGGTQPQGCNRFSNPEQCGQFGDICEWKNNACVEVTKQVRACVAGEIYSDELASCCNPNLFYCYTGQLDFDPTNYWTYGEAAANVQK